jgi:hypothetical protein
MHDPRLSYIYMSKDSLLQCMHEAAAKHGTLLIFSISFRCHGFNFVTVEPLWYGRSWPRSPSERGKSNLERKKNTFILSNYNELVDILSSGREMSWQRLPGAVGSWLMLCPALRPQLSFGFHWQASGTPTDRNVGGPGRPGLG